MSKRISVLLSAVLTLAIVSGADAAKKVATPAKAKTSAKAETAADLPPAPNGPYLLFDGKTGEVLESRDPFHRWYPASLSKLMTVYVAFRAVQAGELAFSSPVHISKAATMLPPSKMGYSAGSDLTLDNAIKILMVKSANDVAQSVGESIAGSQAAFAERMNAESRRLGMTDSHWVNPHGLHDPEQYTSPRDLAILVAALRREFPQYSDYFAIEGLSTDGKAIPSHNNLIGRFQGADGMKTGYTCPAGFNLAASATRDGRTLVAIVLGSETVAKRDDKAAAMLAHGFAMPQGAGPRLADLKPPATVEPAIDNTVALCSKGAHQRNAQEAKALATQVASGLAPAPGAAYLGPLDHERRLVPVWLGGASGPVSRAMVAAAVYANVPTPSWRPDIPAPVNQTVEQGDDTAAAE